MHEWLSLINLLTCQAYSDLRTYVVRNMSLIVESNDATSVVCRGERGGVIIAIVKYNTKERTEDYRN